MNPIRTTTTKAVYGGEGFNSLPVEIDTVGMEGIGKPARTYSSFWKPSQEEISKLLDGAFIRLTCYGGQPGVLLEVEHAIMVEEVGEKEPEE